MENPTFNPRLDLNRLTVEEALEFYNATLGDPKRESEFESAFEQLVGSDAEKAVKITEGLATSENDEERLIAGGFAGYLAAAEREIALALLHRLVADKTAEVRDFAYDTVNMSVDRGAPNYLGISSEEATELARAYFEAASAPKGSD